MVDAPELPPTVTGTARRRAYVVYHPSEVVDRLLEPIDPPIPYEGYPLGEVIFAWSGRYAFVVGGPARDWIFGGALMPSVERARGDSAQMWRTAAAEAE